MPLLRSIGDDFEKSRPFQGLRISLSVHLEAKTACLCRVLERGGAAMHVTGSNPLSTQDDVAAALASRGMDVHARHGATEEEYERDLGEVLMPGPQLIIDDGGDLVHLMHTRYASLIPGVIGGCEETTTGISRLRSMERAGTLRFPMVMVNDADCKHLFDNRYGTGQSVWDGIIRTTTLVVAGKTAVVAGYGWCGKGVAMRAKGLGAKVIVTETDPVRALEAHMDGYAVMPMSDAAPLGEVFITVTGCRDVITQEHFAVMRDGALLCNAGHFNVEVDTNALQGLSADRYEARQNIEGYVMPDGRTLYLLAEGRLVNLASGDGHPAEIMDLSFAVQALSVQYLADHRGALSPGLLAVPREIDRTVAEKKLASLGISTDRLSEKQRRYLGE
jgi:adenosylhomocysteinase